MLTAVGKCYKLKLKNILIGPTVSSWDVFGGPSKLSAFDLTPAID